MGGTTLKPSISSPIIIKSCKESLTFIRMYAEMAISDIEEDYFDYNIRRIEDEIKKVRQYI